MLKNKSNYEIKFIDEITLKNRMKLLIKIIILKLDIVKN